MTIHTMTFWQYPGGTYTSDAADALDVRDEFDAALAATETATDAGNMPMGESEVIDRVYALAWLLKEADDSGESAKWALDRFMEEDARPSHQPASAGRSATASVGSSDSSD